MFRAIQPTVQLQIVEAGSQAAHPSLDRRDSDPKSEIQTIEHFLMLAGGIHDESCGREPHSHLPPG